MARGKRSTIAGKALALGLVPALCVLCLTSGALFVASFALAERSLARDMDALSAVVADNVSASLLFDDPTTASEILSALRAKPNVDHVCVFDGAGRLFAQYAAADYQCGQTSAGLTADRLARVVPVLVRQRRVGVVQLVANDHDIADWLMMQGLITMSALALGAVAAVVLTRRMHVGISRPVLELATAARHVTATGEYTVRVEKSSDDEIGALADAFNMMLDQIQHQSRLKDEFLAALSHELRTPLNAILGWLQILRSTKPEGERLDRTLDSLERNAWAQARLIEDLLDVSRIVTGKLHLRLEPVDLRDVVARAIDSVAPDLVARGLTISTRIPPTPCVMSGDHDRLRQTVINVVANAIKFSNPGGIISVELRDETQGFAIVIEDSGVGISSEFLPHVFDRFRQSDASSTRQYGGLGLGLSIVKEITELHGGTVTATSPGPGLGATFVIRLPSLRRTETLTAPLTMPEGDSRRDTLAGLRALAVDDDADVRHVVAASLRAAGASVDTAASEAETLTLWRRGAYDLFVCDVSMPRTDGCGVLMKIRREHASGKDVVAVALARSHRGDIRERCLGAGFDAYVTKPVDAFAFIGLIENLLAAKARDDDSGSSSASGVTSSSG